MTMLSLPLSLRVFYLLLSNKFNVNGMRMLEMELFTQQGLPAKNKQTIGFLLIAT